MTTGKFNGDLVARFLDDGRVVELTAPFSYTDPDGLLWEAPAGARVDGASIPRALWTLIGGPFEGRYRNASVIHDWYCDRRSRPWKAVHRVFYNGMVTAGVDPVQAKVMYAGVYVGGPRWSDTVIHNVGLPGEADGAVPRGGGSHGARFGVNKASEFTRGPDLQAAAAPYRVAVSDKALNALVEQVRADDPDLAEIEALGDRVVMQAAANSPM